MRIEWNVGFLFFLFFFRFSYWKIGGKMRIEINIEFFFRFHYFFVPTQIGKKWGKRRREEFTKHGQ